MFVSLQIVPKYYKAHPNSISERISHLTDLLEDSISAEVVWCKSFMRKAVTFDDCQPVNPPPTFDQSSYSHFSQEATKIVLRADPDTPEVSKRHYLNGIPAVHNVFSQNDFWSKAPRKSTFRVRHTTDQNSFHTSYEGFEKITESGFTLPLP